MDTVKIIIANAEQTAAHADEIIKHILPYYVQKYKNMIRKQEANQELTAGFLLKEYLGADKNAQLIRTEYKKPFLLSKNVFFNLSHSGEYVVLATADIDIGIDIEKITDVHWQTARKVFSKKQLEQLENAQKEEQSQMFTKLWTECEAFLKLIGTGFAASSEVNLKQNNIKFENSIIQGIKYKDYIITCAAYEEFSMSVEETGWIEERQYRKIIR